MSDEIFFYGSVTLGVAISALVLLLLIKYRTRLVITPIKFAYFLVSLIFAILFAILMLFGAIGIPIIIATLAFLYFISMSILTWSYRGFKKSINVTTSTVSALTGASLEFMEEKITNNKDLPQKIVTNATNTGINSVNAGIRVGEWSFKYMIRQIKKPYIYYKAGKTIYESKEDVIVQDLK